MLFLVVSIVLRCITSLWEGPFGLKGFRSAKMFWVIDIHFYVSNVLLYIRIEKNLERRIVNIVGHVQLFYYYWLMLQISTKEVINPSVLRWMQLDSRVHRLFENEYSAWLFVFETLKRRDNKVIKLYYTRLFYLLPMCIRGTCINSPKHVVLSF